MGLFSFGKSYTIDDLQNEVKKVQTIYRQASGADYTVKFHAELKRELTLQFNELLEVCKKGKFYGGEMVEWCPSRPSYGCYTSLRNVLRDIQIMLEMI